MKKLIKILFGLAVVFFALVVAAVVILPLVISPNDYKPQIVEAVRQQTGRELLIEGDIGLSVFPKIGLTLGHTELSNAPGFEQKVFAKVEGVNIQVALMPLLDKEIKMDEVVLKGLVLNLHRNKEGRTNWEDLAGKKKAAKAKAGKPGGKAPELAVLAIGGVRIEDARVRWQDDLNGQSYDIQNFRLLSGPLIEDRPVELELGTDFASSQPKVKGHLGVTTTLLADVDQQRFTLDALAMNLDASGDLFPGGSARANLNAEQVQLDVPGQALSVAGLVLKTLNMTINGGLKGQAILSGKPQLNGRIQVQTFNARELFKTLGQAVPDTADPKVLTRVGAGFDLLASVDKASLKNLEVRMDDTVLNGTLAVSGFSDPAINFDLNVDQIDLDRYLPASDPASTAAPSGGEAAKQPATGPEPELFPVEALRALNINGVARIGQVRKNKIKATDVVVQVKAKGGHVNLKPSANLYEGKYDADVTVDARPSIPHLKVDAKLDGVQIEPLLKDMQGKAKLAGQTNVDVKISANGNTQSAIKRTLNGNAAFSFLNGALVGVNIARVIREGWAKVRGKPVPTTNEADQTDFSELKGTAKITNGVVDNRDFSMKSPLLRVTGAGQADLVKEELDYLLKTAIVGSLKGQGGEDLDKLKGVTIPVRVKGPFDNPSYKPDLSAALTDTVKQKAKEKVEKKKDDVRQKLKDKLRDKLKLPF